MGRRSTAGQDAAHLGPGAMPEPTSAFPVLQGAEALPSAAGAGPSLREVSTDFTSIWEQGSPHCLLSPFLPAQLHQSLCCSLTTTTLITWACTQPQLLTPEHHLQLEITSCASLSFAAEMEGIQGTGVEDSPRTSVESELLEESLGTTESNHSPGTHSPTIAAKLHPSTSHPPVLWIPPGVGPLPQPWAACSSVKSREGEG